MKKNTQCRIFLHSNGTTTTTIGARKPIHRGGRPESSDAVFRIGRKLQMRHWQTRRANTRGAACAVHFHLADCRAGVRWDAAVFSCRNRRRRRRRTWPLVNAFDLLQRRIYTHTNCDIHIGRVNSELLTNTPRGEILHIYIPLCNASRENVS